jgi:diaminohydroxyphosphoribosylaminopyrimidine deaminase/5-amino-6-(5-phosphoribosylamino)uracil reductase
MSSDRPPSERRFWDRAIELALRGRGLTSPNPMVGAVLVREDRVIGEGWHRRHGGLHAEREALADAEARGNTVEGATMFVTLEPCAHTGSQPPCADALIEAGISELVYACPDPTEKTAGIGPARLSAAGILVRTAGDPTAGEARDLVQDFLKRAETGRPLLILKMAMSLDGAVATRTGDSRWISGPESRRMVHRWRADLDAVAVGGGTAVADRPRLTARLDEEDGTPAEGLLPVRQPTRVIFDSRPSISAGDPLFEDIEAAPVIVVTGPGADPARTAGLESAGAEVVETGPGSRSERFVEALDLLGERGIASVLLEGGPTLASTAFGSGEVDRFEVFVAPIVVGGGRAATGDGGPAKMADAIRATDLRVSRVGQDVHMSAQLKAW